MRSSDSGRDLLFGILALQMDLIDREQLVAAIRAWGQDKARPIEEVLLEQGALNDADRRLLAPLVARHIENHKGDVEESLATVCSTKVARSVESVREALRSLGDPKIEATMLRVAPARKEDRSSQASKDTIDPHTTIDPHATKAPRGAGTITAPASGSSRFRIMRPHAKGGLGEVFVAEDLELGREVALKEIQARYANDPDSRGRFVLEAEVTGGLEHPGVVPVYGLGRYPDGRPYYAMRFIRGESLKQAVDRFHRRQVHGNQAVDQQLQETVGGKAEQSGQHLSDTVRDELDQPEDFGPPSGSDQDSTETRRLFDSIGFRKLLGRFVDVCNAIAYAHSRGVLHRDLKPDNIMLGKYGETLVVDWGLAKVQGRDDLAKGMGETMLRPKSGSGSAATQMGSAIGTPAYMPPEQAAGRLDELGPASDVYSLGATLYYMLTGRPPIQGNNLHDTLEKVRSGDFPAPRKIKPEIPKALEAICLRAMATAAEDRYGSPQELADDVERFLADEPVTAFHEPFVVRARRWMRKHPTPVAALAATILVGLFGAGIIAAIVSGNAKVLANKNRELLAANARLDRANAELEQKNVALEKSTAAERQAKQDALAVIDFFENHVLARARPKGQEGGLGIDATIRAAIDAAEPTIAESFADHPLVEASIRNSLGNTYHYLGEAELAIRQLERACELRRSHLGPDHPMTLTSLNNLAMAYNSAGRLSEALQLHEETLKLRKSKLGPDHPDTLASLNNLALAYQSAGRLGEALLVLEETLKLSKSKLGPDHPETITSMNSLALAYHSAGRLSEALQLFQETLKLTELRLGPDHPDTLTARANLASAYHSAGRYSEALPLLEATLKILKSKLGPDHPDTLNSMNNLAMTYKSVGRLSEALRLFEEALGLAELKLGMDHPLTLTVRANLASAYHSAGRLREALPLYEKTLKLSKSKLGPDHSETLTTMDNLARAYLKVGRVEDALPLLARLVERRREQFKEGDPRFAQLLANVASVLLKYDQHAPAEAYLRECVAICEKTIPGRWPLFQTRSMLGEALAGQKKFDEAEGLLIQGYRGLEERADSIPASDQSLIADALRRLVDLYTAWGKPEEAAKWKARLDAARSVKNIE